MSLERDQKIVLSRHAALKVRGDARILVMPERAIRLRGSSAEILRVCEAPCSSNEVIAIMQSRYPDDSQIDQEVSDFLEEMLGLGGLERSDDHSTASDSPEATESTEASK